MTKPVSLYSYSKKGKEEDHYHISLQVYKMCLRKNAMKVAGWLPGLKMNCTGAHTVLSTLAFARPDASRLNVSTTVLHLPF